MKDGDKLVKQERIKANKRLWQAVKDLQLALYKGINLGGINGSINAL